MDFVESTNCGSNEQNVMDTMPRDCSGVVWMFLTGHRSQKNRQQRRIKKENVQALFIINPAEVSIGAMLCEV